MRLLLQILLPLLVLAGAFALRHEMLARAAKPAVTAPPPSLPVVRTVTAAPTALTIDVHSQGSVEPRSEVTIAAQVSGRVLAMSPALRAGGFFAADDVLLTIDDADFRLAAVQRQADVARAELRLAQERAEAQAAVRAWQQLEGDRPPDPLSTRQLFVAEAEQSLAAARAAMDRTALDAARCRVSLPFPGRVRSSNVAVGQFVVAGTPLATAYGTEVAEVRLPIPDSDAAFLDLALAAPDGNAGAVGTAVELTARFGGGVHRWTGVVDRTEGEIDRRTRQLTVVARIDSPYATGDDKARPPLAVGMFVEATIRGRTFDDVVSLPRSALRPDGTVLVVGAENRLVARPVQVLRQDRRSIHVRGGLQAGEQVCVSQVEAFVEGMPVHVLERDSLPTPQPTTATGATADQRTGGR